MKATAIIQARMGSTRLANKSLSEIAGRSMLEWVAARTESAQLVEEVIVATTIESSDDAIEQEALRLGLRVVRGSVENVLERFAAAQELTESPILVRVTGDCPFISPEIIDIAIEAVASGEYDYVGTDLDGRCARGTDCEAFTREAFKKCVEMARDDFDLEHVTPAMYRYQDESAIRAGSIDPPDWVRYPELRFTVDEPSDLELVRAVVAALDIGPQAQRHQILVPTQTIIALLNSTESLRYLNADVVHNFSEAENFRT